MLARRVTLTTAMLAAAVVVFVAWLMGGWGGPGTVRVVDDLGLAAFAAASVVTSLGAARRTRGRHRHSWIALATASTCWTVGEVIWSYYELVAGRESPSLSSADAGFLLFPAAAIIGLWLYPRPDKQADGRVRELLDGLTVASSLFIVSWATTLGPVYRHGASTPLGFVVALTYPLTDLVLVTFTGLVIWRAQSTRRLPLLLICGGLVALTIGDGSFAALTARNNYHSGDLLDAAWAVAFSLISLAGLADHGPSPTVSTTPRPSWLQILIPYASLAAITLVEARQLTSGHPIDTVVLVAMAIVGTTVLSRQFVTLAENHRLLVVLSAREEELRFLALHDPLTGLANRALFADRLHQAIELRQRDGRTFVVMLTDLDDFKLINDQLGHAAGDELLVEVARRLGATTRAVDTVARLGGDEFATILEGTDRPELVGRRVLAAFADPLRIAGRDIPVHLSIGLLRIDEDSSARTAEEIMRDVDIAMYEAKRQGKDSFVIGTATTPHGGIPAPRFTASVVDEQPPRISLAPTGSGPDSATRPAG